MLDIQTRDAGVVVLSVNAQPGARRNAIVGVHAGMLKVAVTAAPEAGKANDAIVQLLSETLHVSKAAIQLVSGQTSRQKKFAIAGVTPEQVRSILQSALE